MIARIWHGRVPVSKSDQYLKLMRTVAIADKSTPGNRGAFALREIQRDVAQFVTLTFGNRAKPSRNLPETTLRPQSITTLTLISCSKWSLP